MLRLLSLPSFPSWFSLLLPLTRRRRVGLWLSGLEVRIPYPPESISFAKEPGIECVSLYTRAIKLFSGFSAMLTLDFWAGGRPMRETPL